MEKTNVMRLLEQKKIGYRAHTYGNGEALSGDLVAQELGQDPVRVYKTLVAQGASKRYYVFMVPVHGELDLKKAAKASGEKSIAMIKSKELQPLTGYVHGGCSPIGMKKQFATFIHTIAQEDQTIFFSAGKIGYQVEVMPSDLEKMIRIKRTDLLSD